MFRETTRTRASRSRAALAVAFGLALAFVAGAAAPDALAAPPSNDDFVNAQAISGPAGTASGTNVEATKEPGEPLHAGNAGGASIWYRWAAPAGGVATVDTCGSTFDTLLGVYTGDTVNALTEVESNDDSPCGSQSTGQSSVRFAVAAGTVYQIAVDGFGGATGPVTLHWALPPGSVSPPTVSGTPAYGETLSAGPGGWQGVPPLGYG